MAKIKLVSPELGVSLGHVRYPLLHKPTLDENDVEVVADCDEADFVIYFSAEMHAGKLIPPDEEPPFPRSKSVMIMVEPSRSPYRQAVYEKEFLDQYHTAYMYNPHPEAKNQFPLTREPHLFPTSPGFHRVTREDTTLGPKRKFYYAGCRYLMWGSPHKPDSVNLYPLRTLLVDFLRRKKMSNYVTGIGWTQDHTRYDKDWRLTKLNEVIASGSDFVLCLENSRHENYMSEKIHDGFNSDRVVFYLGCPNVGEVIPPDCFINLGDPPYYEETPDGRYPYKFDFHAVMDRILDMSQEEYDAILGRARTFRDSVLTQKNATTMKKRFTLRLLERLRT